MKNLSDVLVVGDSHIRSYPASFNVHPIFVNPGRLFNFISEFNSYNTEHIIFQLLDAATSEMSKFKLIFPYGEAPSRYALNYCWEPRNGTPTKKGFNLIQDEAFSFIDLLKRIKSKFDNRIDIHVVTPPPTFRIGQNSLIKFFTEIVLENSEFFEVINGIEVSKIQFNSLHQIYSDSIHCNTNYGMFILKKILGYNRFEYLQSWPQQPKFEWLCCNDSFLCYKFKTSNDTKDFYQMEFQFE